MRGGAAIQRTDGAMRLKRVRPFLALDGVYVRGADPTGPPILRSGLDRQPTTRRQRSHASMSSAIVPSQDAAILRRTMSGAIDLGPARRGSGLGRRRLCHDP